MTTKGVQHVPWATMITHPDQFTATNQYQWHEGTEVIDGRAKNWGGASSSTFTTNGISWYRQGVSGGSNGTGPDLWTSTGFTSSMQNGKNYNQVWFFGSQVDSGSFTNDTFTYANTCKSSFVQNVIGFSSQTDIAGSFSDEGGDAQARLEKIVFFYMNPTNRSRSTFELTKKLNGTISINSKFTKAMGRNKQWFGYRVHENHISTINNNKLLFMGIGMQFFHGSKVQSHTSANRISNFRIITGTSTTLKNYTETDRLYCFPRVHQWDNLTGSQSYTLP